MHPICLRAYCRARLVNNLVEAAGLPADIAAEASNTETLLQLSQLLKTKSQQQNDAVAKVKAAETEIQDAAEKEAVQQKISALTETNEAKILRAQLDELIKHGDLGIHIWHTFLSPTFPKFLYFDEYYQMQGHDNIEALKTRKSLNKLNRSDHPLLGLIELARLDLDQLINATRTQQLKNKLQGASNYLSGQILKYWSQNKHLRMLFDVRPGLPGDPEGMQQGMNIWGEVFDSKHLVSTGLST